MWFRNGVKKLPVQLKTIIHQNAWLVTQVAAGGTDVQRGVFSIFNFIALRLFLFSFSTAHYTQLVRSPVAWQPDLEQDRTRFAKQSKLYRKSTFRFDS
jgi:hypothetical protein